jgi:hypothetical protein
MLDKCGEKAQSMGMRRVSDERLHTLAYAEYIKLPNDVRDALIELYQLRKALKPIEEWVQDKCKSKDICGLVR